jgi:hypothetical protein
MTARRRAVLRKAQSISARKRKRKRAKRVGGIVAGVGTAVIFGKSIKNYSEVRSYKVHDFGGKEKYSYATHLRVQHKWRANSRKTLIRSVARTMSGKTPKARIGNVPNPWIHKVDAASVSKKKMLKVAFKSYRYATRSPSYD